jgi:uncharacterized protein (TIGR02266 family)
MTQDTRKDRRVKIVSLNVRYKSATVDEFIENHAHDVSRGGIYIKTPNPFPQGTLLKFEIRLASDQAVITGVGRVVWKREAAQGDQPAGMGVKFIKVDDSSKVVIDRLVTTKADAGKSFEAEPDTTAHTGGAGVPHRPGAPPPGKPKGTPYKAVAPAASGGPTPSSRPQVPSSRPPFVPRPAPPAPLFPQGSASGDGPKPEPTVMKQAAELLEEALREAGGSMEEVGSNPLFSGASEATSQPMGTASIPAKGQPSGGASASAPPPASSRSARPSAGATARGMVAALSPGHPPTAKTSGDGASARPAATVSNRPPKKSGSGAGLILGTAAVVAIAVVVFNRDKLFGSTPATQEPTAAPPPPIAPPPPTAASASAALAPSASAAEPLSPEPSASAATGSASSDAAAKPSSPSAQADARAPLTSAPPAPQKVVRPGPPPAPPSEPATPSAAEPVAPAATAPAPAPAPAPKPQAAPAVRPQKAAPKPPSDNPY